MLGPRLTEPPQSFLFQGFPATTLFERAGRIADPMYHNSGTDFWSSDANQPLLTARNVTGDVSERNGYDLEQLVSIARVQVRQQVVCWQTCVD
jgi:hypothetical protein